MTLALADTVRGLKISGHLLGLSALRDPVRALATLFQVGQGERALKFPHISMALEDSVIESS